MRILPVTPERWPDLEALFGPRGAYSNCWCMWPRLTTRDFDATKPAERKRAMKAVVAKGPPPGLIAYDGGEPVAWVAISPRGTTPRLARSRVSKSPDDRPAWAITCFYVRADHRGMGLMEKLADSAAKYAKKRGATLVEAFPVRDTALDGCDGFQGFESTLAGCGFTTIATPTPHRAYMRREL